MSSARTLGRFLERIFKLKQDAEPETLPDPEATKAALTELVAAGLPHPGKLPRPGSVEALPQPEGESESEMQSVPAHEHEVLMC